MGATDPKSGLAAAAAALVSLFREVGWFGIAIALALIFVLRVALPREQRHQLRAPFVLLIAHVLLRVATTSLPKGSVAHEPVYFLELLTLLLSIGRSAFLLSFDVVLGRRLMRPLPAIIRDILQGLVYAGAALVTLRAVGVEAASLLTTSALLTAVVGLSLQETLGNVFAGLAIQAQRPFEVDDWIQVDDQGALVGRVVEINWRATRVLTRDEVEIVIPNGTLAKAPIRNYSKPTPLIRRSIYVQGPYEVSPVMVQRAITEGLRDLRFVEDLPAPSILVASFDDHGVGYWVRYYTRDFQRSETTDAEVRARIWYALDRQGISIPFPVRTLRMAGTEEETRTARDRSDRQRRTHALTQVELFGGLTDDAMDQLASASANRLYAPGEMIIRQGEQGDELFIIEHGEVSVLLATDPHSESSVVASLAPGDFFGEMSLMTGASRTASVRADSECEVVVVDKRAFAPLLDQNPELAEQISRLLAARQEGLASHVESLPPSRRRDVDDRSGQLLEKIRSFFSL